MSTAAFHVATNTLRNCCSGVKSFLFTRLRFDYNRKTDPSCDVNCDLLDKTTFFGVAVIIPAGASITSENI